MLTCEDDIGNLGYDNMTVTIIIISPVADMGLDQSWLREIHTLNGSSSYDSDGDIINYTWTFIDVIPQILYGINPQYDFTNLGNFEITLEITDNDWRVDTDTAWFNISNQLPMADAGPDQNTKRLVTFDGSGSDDSDGLIANYTWTFTYDSTPQELWGVSPVFDFNVSGIYDVMLTVMDNDGAMAFDNVTITISISPPVANAGTDQGTTKGTYVFDGLSSDDSDGSIVNYTWTFNYDGPIQELWGVSPSFDFDIDGIYTVMLKVTDDDWRSDYDNMSVIINYVNPIANAGIDQDTKRLVIFDGSGSDDPDGLIANYTWTFNYDGTPHELWGVSPMFDFNISGVYGVVLMVTDDNNLIDFDDVTITINIVEPIANAGLDQSGFKRLYSLDGSGSSDSDGLIVNYTWSFIYDGVPRTLYGINPSFEFNITGDYEITLNVTDDDWRCDDDVMWVHITNLNPIADAGMDYTTKRLVTLDGSGSSDPDGWITNYTWNFTYDGSFVELWGENPVFDFNIGGLYVIVLTVTDNDNSTSFHIMRLTIVIQTPVADAGLDQVGYKREYWLSGSSSYDSDGIIANYTWNFTYDGSPVVLVGMSPSFIFNITGTYEITLNVTDDDGRYATDTILIGVNNKLPVADAGPDRIAKRFVAFDGSGSSDSDGSIANYTWIFTFDGMQRVLWGISPIFDFNIGGVYAITLQVTDDDGDISVDSSKITTNILFPSANAGINQTGFSGVYCLNGSLSSDLDGVIVNYTWTFDDGGGRVLFGIYPQYDFHNTGSHEITLVVRDDDARMSVDTVYVDIIDRGYPIADAGLNQTTNGVAVLDGTGSIDSDGSIINYTWEFTYNGSQVNLWGIAPQFNFAIDGTYDVVLTVTDNDELIGIGNVTITANSMIPDGGGDGGDGDGNTTNTIDKTTLLAIFVIVVLGILVLFIAMRRSEARMLD